MLEKFIKREVRDEDGNIAFIEDYHFHHFTYGSKEYPDWESARVHIYPPNGEIVSQQLYLGRDHRANELLMPGHNSWLQSPSLAALGKLFAKALNGETYLASPYNAVTFQMYRKNGSVLLQHRSFVNPRSLNVGNISMHGGSIKPEDMTTDYNETCLRAVIREVGEEFNVNVNPEELEHVANVYDPDMGRFNHIYKVTVPIETLLVRQEMAKFHRVYPPSVRRDVEALIESAIANVLNCEGVGRITNMFKADLDRAIETEALTSISLKIFDELPELKPTERPL